MAGPKNTQTRFVGIITSTVHPYACFLSSFNCADKLTSNPAIITSQNNRIFSHIVLSIESRRPKDLYIQHLVTKIIGARMIIKKIVGMARICHICNTKQKHNNSENLKFLTYIFLEYLAVKHPGKQSGMPELAVFKVLISAFCHSYSFPGFSGTITLV